MQYENFKVTCQKETLRIVFDSTDHKNRINALMINQLSQILDEYEDKITVVILEGNETNFCTGADFDDEVGEYHPENLYQLWYRLATGPFITVSHVKGKVIAGGMGFIGASDIVLADENATFCMTELMFGIYPALVFPFLIRKTGFATVNYMALTMETLTAQQATEKRIVDVCGSESKKLLGKHLARLTKIPKSGIKTYKEYVQKIIPLLEQNQQAAVSANLTMFQDEDNKKRIRDFATFGKFPWES